MDFFDHHSNSAMVLGRQQSNSSPKLVPSLEKSCSEKKKRSIFFIITQIGAWFQVGNSEIENEKLVPSFEKLVFSGQMVKEPVNGSCRATFERGAQKLSRWIKVV